MLFLILITITDKSSASKTKFYSTKFNEANIRNGPGLNHLLIYKILVKGYPLKRISAFENWTKIEDFEGRTGWISNSQLSKDKFVISTSKKKYLHKFPEVHSKRVAIVKEKSILRILKNRKRWILVEANNVQGWIKKKHLWGY